MKKTIAVLLAIAFVATVAASSFGRTLEEEKMAVRDYLKVVDAKIIKFRNTGNKTKMMQMQAEKKATLARWEALKAKMEAEAVTPAPVAPAPVVKAAPAGMGMSIGVSAGVAGGLTAISGVLDYSTESILSGTKVRLGADYLTGSNGTDSNLKIATVKLGGLYALDMLKMAGVPLDWYVEGAVAVPVKVSGGRTGSYGLEAALGANYTIPDFGAINAQVGYSALKYGSATSGAAKGVLATIGYAYSF